MMGDHHSTEYLAMPRSSLRVVTILAGAVGFTLGTLFMLILFGMLGGFSA